ncbi:MAG: 4-hydroxy-tetrahydrodipicolinate reductase [Myxococcota bacterium]
MTVTVGSPIRLVVSGARGRLGSQIARRAAASDRFVLHQALVRSDSPGVGADVEGVTCSSTYVPEPNTVLVEAATPVAALDHGARAAEAGVPILLATTGFRSENQQVIDGWSRSTAVCVAPNLSVGVNLMLDLVARAAAALPDYDLEILELHHRRKKDAPSGTAWALAEAAADGRGWDDLGRRVIHARAGEVGARSNEEVGIMAIRGGDIIGEHTVFFVGETERIELTHRAATRDAFAHGALVASAFLAAQTSPGRYSMRQVLGLT